MDYVFHGGTLIFTLRLWRFTIYHNTISYPLFFDKKKVKINYYKIKLYNIK
jgi:hypothetical protein